MSNLEEYGLSAEVETITPEQAAAYLSNNAKHRPIKDKKVLEYINHQLAFIKQWEEKHSTIQAIDKELK